MLKDLKRFKYLLKENDRFYKLKNFVVKTHIDEMWSKLKIYALIIEELYFYGYIL